MEEEEEKKEEEEKEEEKEAKEEEESNDIMYTHGVLSTYQSVESVPCLDHP